MRNENLNRILENIIDNPDMYFKETEVLGYSALEFKTNNEDIFNLIKLKNKRIIKKSDKNEKFWNTFNVSIELGLLNEDINKEKVIKENKRIFINNIIQEAKKKKIIDENDLISLKNKNEYKFSTRTPIDWLKENYLKLENKVKNKLSFN